jgi:hypothetical protein
MPRVEFEPTIPVLERAKMVHALDRAATVIGSHPTSCSILINRPVIDSLQPRY